MPGPTHRACRAAAALALAALTVTVTACSDGRKKVYPVRGVIRVDGKPAAECIIMFHPPAIEDPKRVMPFGQADADGKFAICSYVSGDGAPEGEYIVTFEWRERSGLMKQNFDGPDRLKGKYSDPKKSEFRVKVEKQPMDLPPFELKSK
jgi:hypothetical protein